MLMADDILSLWFHCNLDYRHFVFNSIRGICQFVDLVRKTEVVSLTIAIAPRLGCLSE